MSRLAVAVPETRADRLRWALIDGWTITKRDLNHWVRQPGMFIFGLIFPLMIVVMFGVLFGGAIDVPNGESYLNYLIPGQFALTMAFGLESTYTAVTTDLARGVTDRFRSMPAAPSAVVVGRCVADLINSVLGLLTMALGAWAIGWRPDASAGALVTGFALLILLRFSLLWMGIYLALVFRSPEALMAVQILVWPIGFLSSVYVAPATMPGWIAVIAEWNPLSSTATAVRDLFGNQGWEATSWIAQNAGLMAVVWPLVITAIFFPLCVRRYANLSK